jgi:hypothetical protein
VGEWHSRTRPHWRASVRRGSRWSVYLCGGVPLESVISRAVSLESAIPPGVPLESVIPPKGPAGRTVLAGEGLSGREVLRSWGRCLSDGAW